MSKHLRRIATIVICFELYRLFGRELFAYVRNLPGFHWVSDRQLLLHNLIEIVIISLSYPLTQYVIFEKNFKINKRKTFIYGVIATVLIITARYVIEEVILYRLFGFRNYYPEVSILYYYVDNLYYAILYSAFGILYYFFQNDQWAQVERQQLQLSTHYAQLQFLKTQINPHFLFNSINNIYSLVYQKSDKSLEAMLKLSDIMRYMLYQEKEKVPLLEELNYVQKFIELQLLRFKQTVVVDKRVEGQLEKVLVPPLVLVPFIENAFKHGDFTGDGAHLSLTVRVADRCLSFYIRNKIGIGCKDEGGGIGLANIRQRLALLYPGKHTLTIEEDETHFTVYLKINL